MSAWEVVACRVCGEQAGNRCRTLKTHRVTDTHTTRLFDAWDSRRKYSDATTT